MSALITLSKKDPRFHSYIEGTFSKDMRALPVRSLNVNTESEQVTFQLFPRKEIEPAFLGLHWLQVLKVRNFLLVAFPVFLVFMKNWTDQVLMDPITACLSAAGAFCLMAAVNLRSDYLDHLSGLDRMHPRSESYAIQQGWVTAAEVRRWSYVYLFLGVLFGLRALWLYPQIIFLVGGFAVLGIFGMTSFRMGLKYRRWSEWTVFLLLGPMLTTGIQFSSGAPMEAETLFLGVLTGWMAVFYLHLKNFEQLMVNNQAQFQNTMTWLGFEKGKRWLLIWWLGFVILFLAYQFQFYSIFWLALMAAACLLVTLPLAKVLRRLKSPLGSDMRLLIQIGNQALLFLTGLWILQVLWTIWL